ncbi:hypothetical protein GCM10010112_71390 [Actinoplanes lobatus]|uniref:Resolvase/invertase-type recombinase catalytic domain-containing protein n=1 Tax=Actinoplanes lobatus TaxID=113568 RepID=A0A7W7MJP4_9ACTN|nr:hypothetical protein [Actinoplanes lobatus]MBB4752882.1 hypothetical protein [Actinoplanes lobatus]GGN88165.1 hypothetical protein GCM10010112_71390 [Actinoplanes lobatus]GIE39490.1 hypothetical protein Alo02nite_23880 [Actinoplanes lobatus]
MGAMFFAVLAVAGQIERDYIREKTLEGQIIAAAKGNHGGRPKVIDDDSLTFALALKDKGIPVPAIAKKLTIRTGKNAGTPRPWPRSTGRLPRPSRPLRPTIWPSRGLGPPGFCKTTAQRWSRKAAPHDRLQR